MTFQLTPPKIERLEQVVFLLARTSTRAFTQARTQRLGTSKQCMKRRRQSVNSPLQRITCSVFKLHLRRLPPIKCSLKLNERLSEGLVKLLEIFAFA
jgi:hypothetical protein